MKRSEAAKRRKATQAAEGLFTTTDQQKSASPINGPMPRLGRGFDAIVERTFDLADPAAEFEVMVDRLKVKDALTPGGLQAALNDAEDNARRAHRLYVVARADFDRFEVESAEVLGALRDAATAELQAEKAAGERSKSITNDDVTSRVAQMFPDEHREISDRKVKASGTLEHMKRLADLWQSRCYSIGNMLSAGRR